MILTASYAAHKMQQIPARLRDTDEPRKNSNRSVYREVSQIPTQMRYTDQMQYLRFSWGVPLVCANLGPIGDQQNFEPMGRTLMTPKIATAS